MAKLIGVLNYYSGRIAANGTVPVANATAYVSTVHITCTQAAAGSTLKVQTKESTPKLLCEADLSTTGLVVSFGFGAGAVGMSGGIDIVKTGPPTTANVWITFSQ